VNDTSVNPFELKEITARYPFEKLEKSKALGHGAFSVPEGAHEFAQFHQIHPLQRHDLRRGISQTNGKARGHCLPESGGSTSGPTTASTCPILFRSSLEAGAAFWLSRTGRV